MQLKSSTTNFSEFEQLRVEYIHANLFSVTFTQKCVDTETKFQLKLTKDQLHRLHMMVGIMLPETNNEA